MSPDSVCLPHWLQLELINIINAQCDRPTDNSEGWVNNTTHG